MFGKNPEVSPLAARKQLLIAESEINRAALSQDWAALTGGVHSFRSRVTSFRSVASMATMLIGLMSSYRRGRGAKDGNKRSWWQKIMTGVQLGSSLWFTMRQRPK